MKKIIFASKNEGKIRELRSILKDMNVSIVSLTDIDFTGEIVESGSSFEENAKIKAMEIYNMYRIPVIADDSGLVVDKLNGEPGIFSARYSGENATDEINNLLLIKKLNALPEPHKAKFVCAAVYFDGTEIQTAIGEVNGKIINKPRGTKGFGYDPLFIPDGFTQTMGELDDDIKNKISHRYNAFNKLKKIISN
ncbi:MAG TPA: RdgB/HAM1 family non-canonical purine NTP pyrophosphatase [Ignavibacteriaceae bacterium]|nr:RdgB/HAM1 family non-canonical purine NTP pyrophosphatase [Ignavibacteriaceae bacterium]